MLNISCVGVNAIFRTVLAQEQHRIISLQKSRSLETGATWRLLVALPMSHALESVGCVAEKWPPQCLGVGTAGLRVLTWVCFG